MKGLSLTEQKIKVAVIDLYNGEENQGIRCIRDILNETDCNQPDVSLDYKFYETRNKLEVPNLDYDIYISSGGPGSPWDGAGTVWEAQYFRLLDLIWTHNHNHERKKYVFFICHSFQIMARYFKLGEVVKRHSKSFGVKPVHITEFGKEDSLLRGLHDVFYGADFREWQVVQPNRIAFEELGAKVLCLEKNRPHVQLERAMMAIRINDEFSGTQFHPEADAASMYHHFRQPERKEHVVSKYGEQKYYEMLNLLEVEEGIKLTRKTVLPNFLKDAIAKLQQS
jgi:GMP synthase-like glutamine amidotransferase